MNKLEVKREGGRVVARRRRMADAAPETELTNAALLELRRLVSLVDGRAIRARIKEVK
jgi:hypothetical protein